MINHNATLCGESHIIVHTDCFAIRGANDNVACSCAAVTLHPTVKRYARTVDGLTKHNVYDSVLAYRELTVSSSDNRNFPATISRHEPANLGPNAIESNR